VLGLTPSKLARTVAELVREGWHVQADGKLYRQPGEFRIEVSSGIDWFELHGDVQFGDQVATLPQLLAALRKGESLIQLGDGTVGMLPEEWLKRYAPLAGMGQEAGDHLRFGRTQIGLLDALLAAQPEVTCDEVFEQGAADAAAVRADRAARSCRRISAGSSARTRGRGWAG